MKFDGKKRLDSLIWNTREGYQIGDKIKAAKKLSHFKRRNAELINCLSELHGEVVHSFIHLREVKACFSGTNSAIVECFIPKGEYYWENVIDGEYASVSLKISRILYFESYQVEALRI
jgi:hypothetical protein